MNTFGYGGASSPAVLPAAWKIPALGHGRGWAKTEENTCETSLFSTRFPRKFSRVHMMQHIRVSGGGKKRGFLLFAIIEGFHEDGSDSAKKHH